MRNRSGKNKDPQPVQKTTRTTLLAGAIFVVTALLYLPVAHYDFVNFDDPEYITNNAHVRNGLTIDGVTWAFTSTEAANWLPLTRITELLDYQLFSADAGWHHWMNVAYHSLAALFLFLFLNRATRAPWPSAFAALVFGLHPLHVESVAWVSERKDVLCALFFFLTLYLYVRYTERKAAGRYVATLIAFILALLSKPMAVTLPLILVLLDYWPLRRPLVPALKEKLPFVGISVASAIVTFLAQQGGGAVRELASFPLGLRIENAIVSYAEYIAQMFWPANLAVFYPYPVAIAAWKIGLAALVLVGVSAIVLRLRSTQPYLTVGWLWFLITLLPVIGLIQVGAQAHADRYTYFTQTGLCIAIAWCIQRIVPEKMLAPVFASVALILGIVAYRQIQYWQNSETLFRHAIAVTDRNYLAEHNLGLAIAEDPNRTVDAIQHYRAALEIEPNSARAHTDLGTALSRIPSLLPEAVAEYQAAVRILPSSPIPHNNLGNTLSLIPGRLPQAIAQYETALQLKPDYDDARRNLAVTRTRYGVELAKSGHASEAVVQLQAALQLRPDDADTHNNLGVVLANMAGREPDALAQFEKAVRLDPNYPDARVNLGLALLKLPNRKQDAIEQLQAALRLKPDPEVEDLLNKIK